LNGGIYVFNAKTRSAVASYQQETLLCRPDEVMGRYDWQDNNMEIAFREVEEVIGHTDHVGPFNNERKTRAFATWVALHWVRRGANLGNISGTDYRVQVAGLRDWILKQNVTFQDFEVPVLITGDNPVMLISHPDGDFIVTVLSPMRCAYIVWDNRLPGIKGQPGIFQPRNVNLGIINTSACYCVSFDLQLHLP